jgi:type I restriction enzyme M protein
MHRFTTDCQETVPQAMMAFLESNSFEDAIRNAVSLGGDSDTLAAIAGAIAEAYYGIPEQIKERALGYFDAELLSVYEEWVRFIKTKSQ